VRRVSWLVVDGQAEELGISCHEDEDLLDPENERDDVIWWILAAETAQEKDACSHISSQI